MEDNLQRKIKLMQEGGRYASELRHLLATSVKPGITTLDLENIAKEFYKTHGVSPSFLGYMEYPYNIVVCINEEVVHGMPSDRIISDGDLVTVDLGVFHKGYHTDTATTVQAGMQSQQEFLAVGRQALDAAIRECIVGNHVGDISHAMQSIVEEHGFSVIRAFVGHGIGKKLHESLQIPCFGRKGDGEELREGMTIAVEVMYVEKSFAITILDDGWTAVTKDGRLSAMFEHTVAITADGPLILTE